MARPAVPPAPERNWSGDARLLTAAGEREDTVPDDMALVVDTAPGLVVITGCSHTGIVNIVEHARATVRPGACTRCWAACILFRASEETLAWTARQSCARRASNLCRGALRRRIETDVAPAQLLGLDRSHGVVGRN